MCEQLAQGYTVCFSENLTSSDRQLDSLDENIQDTTDRVEAVNNRIEAIKGLVDQLKVMADELRQNATAIKELDVSGTSTGDLHRDGNHPNPILQLCPRLHVSRPYPCTSPLFVPHVAQ